MELVEVKKRLECAVHLLYTKENFLLEVDANERSITSQLGSYLRVLFEEWDVDCEYNRDGHEPKRLGIDESKLPDEGCSVYPDIIIHKRGVSGVKGANLLVIEAKKVGTNGKDYDLKKLRLYKEQLSYQYAAFVEVDTRKGYQAPKICWNLESPDAK